MNTLDLIRVNNYADYYNNYHYGINQNDAPCPQQACESIFIYTCEPVEAVSFKGRGVSLNKTTAMAGLSALAAIGSVAASCFRKLAGKSDYEADIKKIIQNQKDMEYICALKRDFVPYSEFDEMVLSNYNKNLELLEKENKELISKNVDRILAKKKYKDLPSGYSERIKNSVEAQSTWDGDRFEITEQTIDTHILKLRLYDEDKARINAEQNQALEKDDLKAEELDEILSEHNGAEFDDFTAVLKGMGINDEKLSNSPVEDLITQIDNEIKDKTETDRTVSNIMEDVSEGRLSVDEALEEIIELLNKINLNPNCSEDNIHEGVIGVIE